MEVSSTSQQSNQIVQDGVQKQEREDALKTQNVEQKAQTEANQQQASPSTVVTLSEDAQAQQLNSSTEQENGSTEANPAQNDRLLEGRQESSRTDARVQARRDNQQDEVEQSREQDSAEKNDVENPEQTIERFE